MGVIFERQYGERTVKMESVYFPVKEDARDEPFIALGWTVDGQQHGYFRELSLEHLAALRDECQWIIDHHEANTT